MNRQYQFVTVVFVTLLSILIVPVQGWGDHPIDVQRLAAQGEYFQALATNDRVANRVSTTDSVLAAARSAWALSLPQPAADLYEKALRDSTLSPTDRARIELARGIIEYQENRPQVAALFADRALARLPNPGPLRSKVWLLHAESKMKLRAFGAAERFYEKALEESDPADVTEVSFLLGQCQVVLGKETEARVSLKRVPLDHERTPAALRYLAQISLRSGDSDQTAFWLETGREKYPESFLDSWVDYALLKIAAEQNNFEKVREIREQALKKYPPSDYWLSLLEAQAEVYEWQRRQPAVQEVAHADKR